MRAKMKKFVEIGKFPCKKLPGKEVCKKNRKICGKKHKMLPLRHPKIALFPKGAWATPGGGASCGGFTTSGGLAPVGGMAGGTAGAVLSEEGRPPGECHTETGTMYGILPQPVGVAPSADHTKARMDTPKGVGTCGSEGGVGALGLGAAGPARCRPAAGEREVRTLALWRLHTIAYQPPGGGGRGHFPPSKKQQPVNHFFKNQSTSAHPTQGGGSHLSKMTPGPKSVDIWPKLPKFSTFFGQPQPHPWKGGV